MVTSDRGLPRSFCTRESYVRLSFFSRNSRSGVFVKEVEITRHSLVPKHELLSAKEKEELLKNYGISLRQLPRILENDAMVKFLNAKVGDVIKITRKSETAGETVYYRVVIKA